MPFDVVPGVTSAVAAPALAGIPVTHRGLASAFLVVAATTRRRSRRRSAGSTPDGVTLVVLMGLARAAALAGRLIDARLAAATPAAIIVDASTPEQQVWRGTLDDLAADRTSQVDRRPAAGTIVVGDVVALAGAASRARVAAVRGSAARARGATFAGWWRRHVSRR